MLIVKHCRVGGAGGGGVRRSTSAWRVPHPPPSPKKFLTPDKGGCLQVVDGARLKPGTPSFPEEVSRYIKVYITYILYIPYIQNPYCICIYSFIERKTSSAKEGVCPFSRLFSATCGHPPLPRRQNFFGEGPPSVYIRTTFGGIGATGRGQRGRAPGWPRGGARRRKISPHAHNMWYAVSQHHNLCYTEQENA